MSPGTGASLCPAAACQRFALGEDGVGAAFIKVCCYAPYPVKVWCNGHEIARRAALAEGIAVTPLANGFAATSDPAWLQELCDLVQAGTVRESRRCAGPSRHTRRSGRLTVHRQDNVPGRTSRTDVTEGVGTVCRSGRFPGTPS